MRSRFVTYWLLSLRTTVCKFFKGEELQGRFWWRLVKSWLWSFIRAAYTTSNLEPFYFEIPLLSRGVHAILCAGKLSLAPLRNVPHVIRPFSQKAIWHSTVEKAPLFILKLTMAEFHLAAIIEAGFCMHADLLSRCRGLQRHLKRTESSLMLLLMLYPSRGKKAMPFFSKLRWPTKTYNFSS